MKRVSVFIELTLVVVGRDGVWDKDQMIKMLGEIPCIIYYVLYTWGQAGMCSEKASLGR